MVSISEVAHLDRIRSGPPSRALIVLTERTMPRPMGSSIATVAVFEMKAEITADIAPNATTVRIGEPTTQGIESTRRAIRRSSPCTVIARAITNPPRNVKIVSFPNAPRTVSSSPTPRKTHSRIANTAVTASGRASVIHQTMTSTKTAASARCGHSNPCASSRTARNPTGPSGRPMRARRMSNRPEPAAGSSGGRAPECCSWNCVTIEPPTSRYVVSQCGHRTSPFRAPARPVRRTAG